MLIASSSDVQKEATLLLLWNLARGGLGEAAQGQGRIATER
jgi:hypothetical protein